MTYLQSVKPLPNKGFLLILARIIHIDFQIPSFCIFRAGGELMSMEMTTLLSFSRSFAR